MVYTKEVESKSVLSRSGIYGVDYSVNPYLGCEHGCVYCYARFMLKYAHCDADWGRFVHPKINAPDVLERELLKARKGLVLLSSVTDPYQPLERKYNLARRILETLLRHQFSVSILTKSSLVTRDIDVLQQFDECEVGFTIVTLDEDVRRNFEPRSDPIGKRLMALRSLHEGGVKTYVFVGPVLPSLTEETLEALLNEVIEAGIDHVLFDKLNIKYGNWRSIKQTLLEHYPRLVEKYERVLFSKSDYFEKLKQRAAQLCRNTQVRPDFCY